MSVLFMLFYVLFTLNLPSIFEHFHHLVQEQINRQWYFIQEVATQPHKSTGGLLDKEFNMKFI